MNPLDKPPLRSRVWRGWLMPAGRVTAGTVARALAVVWAVLIALATPAALLQASKQLAENAQRDASGVLMLAAVASIAIVVALVAWGLWWLLGGLHRAPESDADGGPR